MQNHLHFNYQKLLVSNRRNWFHKNEITNMKIKISNQCLNKITLMLISELLMLSLRESDNF